jgi:cobalt/nickel transport system ATP-binding protein
MPSGLEHPPYCPRPDDETEAASSLPAPVGETVMEVEDLHFSYTRDVTAIADVAFKVMSGESIALCGHNGSGKTTLMKLLAGLLKPSQGSVRVAGIHVGAKSAGEIFRTVGLLFQDSQDQLFCTTVGDDVAYGPRNLGLSEAEIRKRVTRALDIVEARHLEHRPIHHLSGGEMKRVALAGLIAMHTPVFIMDEPFNGLDPSSTARLVSLIRHLATVHGYTILITTHQMNLVPEVADRMLIMREGRLVADGPVRELLTDIPLLEQARLQPPNITKYFYQQALREKREPGRLPLTLDEALIMT